MVKKKRQPDAHEESTDSSEEKSSPASSDGCQHVKLSVCPSKLRKALKVNGLMTYCGQCQKSSTPTNNETDASELIDDFDYSGFEYDNTLWLCLQCGTQLCGRSRNQHALQHFKTPHSDSHSLTMNTRSFEIWCYECDSDVNPKSRKNLLDCVDLVRKLSQKSTPLSQVSKTPLPLTIDGVAMNNIGNKIATTWESLRPLTSEIDNNTSFNNNNSTNNKALPLPPAPPIPGMAKRVNESSSSTCIQQASTLPVLAGAFGPAMQLFQEPSLHTEKLPRVRGLTNLGNTCFFNAVLQCLAQTPYLLEVLKEYAEPGEEFVLPGGTFKCTDGEDMELPPIKGTLCAWGTLTSSLAVALEELQSGGPVFTPKKLFDKLCAKCPQFCGGEQHDSHELLRHLLESVRSEDLKRYQRVILQSLGYKDQDPNNVSEELRLKCKMYGNQASDRILRPEQVFRGFLVSTLTCQDCYNVSSRHEYFLDMSLPVSVEKPQPPQRRKNSPDNETNNSSFFLNSSEGPSKSQLKKEMKRKRPVKYSLVGDGAGASGDKANGSNSSSRTIVAAASTAVAGGGFMQNENTSGSSSEQSDADVEDNLIDEQSVKKNVRPNMDPLINTTKIYDSNGNNQLPSPTNPEKRDDSPENIDKDSLDEDENDSGIATSPGNAGSSKYPPSSNDINGGGAGSSSDAATTSGTTNNSILSIGLSEKGVNLVRQLSQTETQIKPKQTKFTSPAAIIPTISYASALASKTSVTLTNGNIRNSKDEINVTATQLDELQLNKQKIARKNMKRTRTQSYSDWSTTIAPRYQCEDGECSIQSCLNNFTAVELMTGNNKVGCENCTRNINGDDPKAKTVNTNATKQFLISSPPAVLILHLKRFQLGLRCIFRKLTRPVTFPLVLDIAPFCGSKVKNLPNINRKQKKLLYALYGIVEHSGGMYGGHYTAYVKVRAKLSPDDKRWKFMPQGSKSELDQDDEQRKKLEELLAKEKARDLRMKAADDSDDFSASCTSTSSSDPEDTVNDAEIGAVGGDTEAHNVKVPPGKWYYVSDSRVNEVNEETVLGAQAYLLFYERIY